MNCLKEEKEDPPKDEPPKEKTIDVPLSLTEPVFGGSPNEAMLKK